MNIDNVNQAVTTGVSSTTTTSSSNCISNDSATSIVSSIPSVTSNGEVMQLWLMLLTMFLCSMLNSKWLIRLNMSDFFTCHNIFSDTSKLKVAYSQACGHELCTTLVQTTLQNTFSFNNNNNLKNHIICEMQLYTCVLFNKLSLLQFQPQRPW